MTISIKMEPELRHVLAHIIYAIEANAKGEPAEALYELSQIKGLVFWDTDSGQTVDAREWARSILEDEDDGREELQGQGIEQTPDQSSGARQVMPDVSGEGQGGRQEG